MLSTDCKGLQILSTLNLALSTSFIHSNSVRCLAASQAIMVVSDVFKRPRGLVELNRLIAGVHRRVERCGLMLF